MTLAVTQTQTQRPLSLASCIFVLSVIGQLQLAHPIKSLQLRSLFKALGFFPTRPVQLRAKGGRTVTRGPQPSKAPKNL